MVARKTVVDALTNDFVLTSFVAIKQRMKLPVSSNLVGPIVGGIPFRSRSGPLIKIRIKVEWIRTKSECFQGTSWTKSREKPQPGTRTNARGIWLLACAIPWVLQRSSRFRSSCSNLGVLAAVAA